MTSVILDKTTRLPTTTNERCVKFEVQVTSESDDDFEVKSKYQIRVSSLVLSHTVS